MFRSDLKDTKFFEQLVFWNVIFEWQSIDLIQEEEANAIQLSWSGLKRVDIPIVNTTKRHNQRIPFLPEGRPCCFFALHPIQEGASSC